MKCGQHHEEEKKDRDRCDNVFRRRIILARIERVLLPPNHRKLGKG